MRRIEDDGGVVNLKRSADLPHCEEHRERAQLRQPIERDKPVALLPPQHVVQRLLPGVARLVEGCLQLYDVEITFGELVPRLRAVQAFGILEYNEACYFIASCNFNTFSMKNIFRKNYTIFRSINIIVMNK